MLLAMAVLLIHPQIAPAVPLASDNTAMDDSASIIDTPRDRNDENSLATVASLPSLSASSERATTSAVESSAALPDAPAPMLAAVKSPAPMAFIKPGKSMTVSVEQLPCGESPAGTHVDRSGDGIQWRRHIRCLYHAASDYE